MEDLGGEGVGEGWGFLILLERDFYCVTEVFKDSLWSEDGDSAFGDEGVGALRGWAGDWARQSENIAVEVEGVVGGDESAGFFGGFYDDGGLGHAGDDAVAGGECPTTVGSVWWVFAHECAVVHENMLGKGVVFAGRDFVVGEAGAEYGDGDTVCVECCLVGSAVDTECETGDDGEVCGCECGSDFACGFEAISCGFACADDGDGVEIGECLEVSAHVEWIWRLGDGFEMRWVGGVMRCNGVDGLWCGDAHEMAGYGAGQGSGE